MVSYPTKFPDTSWRGPLSVLDLFWIWALLTESSSSSLMLSDSYSESNVIWMSIRKNSNVSMLKGEIRVSLFGCSVAGLTRCVPFLQKLWNRRWIPLKTQKRLFRFLANLRIDFYKTCKNRREFWLEHEYWKYGWFCASIPSRSVSPFESPWTWQTALHRFPFFASWFTPRIYSDSWIKFRSTDFTYLHFY